MRHFSCFIFTLLLLAGCSSSTPVAPENGSGAIAGGHTGDRVANIDTLLAHSEVGNILGSFSRRFVQRVRQEGLGLDSTQQRRLTEEGRVAFDSTALTNYVRAYFAEHFQDTSVAAVLRGLRSDTVRRVESAVRQDVAPGALRRYAQGLSANPPAQERVRLIRRMSRAQHATAFYVDNTLELRRAVASAAERTGGGNRSGASPPDRSVLRRNAQNMALVSFLYRYESVPDNALEDYVRFYESAPGQWYVGTYSDAITYAIRQAAAVLGAALEPAG